MAKSLISWQDTYWISKDHKYLKGGLFFFLFKPEREILKCSALGGGYMYIRQILFLLLRRVKSCCAPQEP
ncbi:hypothetical protein ES332_D05G116000v1 [Gossypium tomentosum]|uniref:Uncharacterized protein n=1 Tax=Gossypium tomentosum TaxID=34277 RepID=A0A5D2KTB5_GOSTO|nr:hypothetical protein ES332_D05G116000v1 [Gossypium tomentosum]